jgi:hypothetical protein
MTRLLQIVILSLLSAAYALGQTKDAGFRISDNIEKKRIDILYHDTLLTSYHYGDSLMKPVLFPINTRSGLTVTRGFPIAPRTGERIDHPHHIGMWFNYESVNGLDFWNNSTAIPYKNRAHYGRIVHDGVVKTSSDKEQASLEVTARWVDHRGTILLRENTKYYFKISGRNFVIDRVTSLSALEEPVVFKDVKDGLLGLRVARELEQPSDEAVTFVDNKGNATKVEVVNKEGVTGLYRSSEGLTGNDVWGTRGAWVTLSGKIKEDSVSITILDHPANPGYPAYWHARGYGLFAVNPLGQEVFSKGKEKLNLTLNKHEGVTFRYRVIIRDRSSLSMQEREVLKVF